MTTETRQNESGLGRVRRGASVRRFATVSLAVAGMLSIGADAPASPGFEPLDGRYRGEYTSGDHGPGKLRLKVELLRPGLHGVRLLRRSGELRCDQGTRNVDVPMTAARDGREFSGFVTYTSPPGKDSFTGRFTARDALKATVRVSRGRGEDRCETGPIKFAAQRVGPSS